MPINIKSLQARLVIVAREKKLEHQNLFNRFGVEQFLERLSRSSVARKFVFKGGTLLAYLIETDRKTRDLDFSVTGTHASLADFVSRTG